MFSHSSSSRQRARDAVATRRVPVTEHPLKQQSRSNSPVPDQIVTTTTTSNPTAAAEEAASISTHSSLTTTINTASLIQSAARSVLDSLYTPTSTNDVSDDEDEDADDEQSSSHVSEIMNESRSGRRHVLPSPTLQSLQRETLPAMPDEQDRKRFVGCLAAMLASAFDYDVTEQEEDNDASRAESYAYLNKSEQGHDSSDEEEEDFLEESFHQEDNMTAARLDLDDDDDEHDSHLNISAEEEPYLPHSCSASFEYSEASQQIPGLTPSHSDSALNYPHPHQHRSVHHHQESKKNVQARNRHRKRRYDVLSKLLLSSAELLLLDKSQARAFLPMLAKLLVPPNAEEKAKADRIRQRKIQQERERQWQFKMQQYQQQKQQQQQHLDEQLQQQQQRKPPLHNQQQQQHSNYSSPTKSTATTNISTYYNSPNPSLTTSAGALSANNHHLAKQEKGINHYHFSPSRTMPVSRTIPLPDNMNPEQMDLIEYGREEDDYFLPSDLDEEDHLRPFLESLSRGAGFRCLSLLLLQHLLHSDEGYDARIRHAIKKLGVVVLIHDIELERELEMVDENDEEEFFGPSGNRLNSSSTNKAKKKRRRQKRQTPLMKYEDLVGPATRKFEALEHAIAVRLIRISKEQQRLHKLQKKQQQHQHRGRRQKQQRYPPRGPPPPSSSGCDDAFSSFSREQFLRGLKIGSAGLVAGTIFAVTGGLAAPGIAAGLAAISGSAAATAAVVTLVSSTPAVTAIFGVGGGSLAAYKMQRRMQGLTEFEFKRQDKLPADGLYHENDDEEQAELFSTVCVSGWLRDERDFQRPWGVAPTNPKITDRLELLERFYSVYRPDHVSKCEKILKNWKGEERQLWKLLRQKYGRDPDHLYPILETQENGFHKGLTLEQEELLDELFVELGFIAAENADFPLDRSATKQTSPSAAFQSIKETMKHPSHFFHSQNTRPHRDSRRTNIGHAPSYHNTPALMDESLLGPGPADGLSSASSGFDSVSTSFVASSSTTNSSGDDNNGDEKEQYVPPRHLATVWDYHSKYGGELYTVKWESEMLIELCDSVTDLAFDVINGATAQILRQTALHTLLSAVTLPYALISAANMIDGTWTLAVERADEAGKELARSLLFSRAGHRPVTLVGFSFGARAIYSCLKELARYQEKWESSRESNQNGGEGYCCDGDPNSSSGNYSWTTREPASIVEDVILMGLPNHLSLTSWKACRQIVGGRLVNCYSRKDLILSLMFQFKRLAGRLRPVCGTCAVDISGVENVDVTDLVSGHQDYCLVAGEVLKRVRHGQPFRSSVKVVSESTAALQ